jgi:opacity protein-like surface antigen
MLLNKNLAIAALGTALLAVPAFSQGGAPENRSEASVQFFGTFVTNTTDKGATHSASDSGGVLASYRFFFTNRQGVEVNYGYSRSSQNYDFGTGPNGVSANQHEVSAAYVFRFPMGRRITPFVEAGVGGLIFDPRNFVGTSTQARAAFLYGAGADLSVTRHVFVRAAYRGLVYNSPTFDAAPYLGVDRATHQAEPSIGFGYRF